MINVMAVVLLLIGIGERRRFRAAEASGAPPPERTYQKYFIAAAVFVGIFVVYVASQMDVDAGESRLAAFGHTMLQEAAFGAALAVLLSVVWLIGKIRAERILRIVLALWLTVWVAVAGWLVWDAAVRYVRKDLPQKKRHLLFCRKLIEKGKRDELAKFLRETDHECREWNAAFEAKFPEAGGEK